MSKEKLTAKRAALLETAAHLMAKSDRLAEKMARVQAETEAVEAAIATETAPPAAR